MIEARTAAWIALGLAGLSSGCHKGDGSNIGPDLVPLPNYDYRILVRDDAGRPVTGAVVAITGARTAPVTGRSGRASLPEFLSGARLITVDGSNAAAVDASQLGALTVAANLPDGDELPFVFYLPDHSTSSGLALTTGVQGTVPPLDDKANDSGAEFTIATGDTVTFGGASSVTVRTGRLSAGHLPGVLAVTSLVSRAIYIHPAGVQFANGARLSIPDDLTLATAQSATLYLLDPSTGVWASVGTATETAGRIEAPFGSVRSGGLYCFAVPATATTAVAGRVLDADARPVPGVLVRVPQANSRTASDGRFTLPAIARTDAQGANRTITVELHGGRDYLPVGTSTAIALDAASVDVGDVTLTTRRTTNVRMLMIRRGLLDANQRLRISGRQLLTTGNDNGGDNATVSFEDLTDDFVGVLTTKPRDVGRVFRTQGVFEIHADARDNPFTVHANELVWRPAQSNGTLVRVVDSVGTGPLSGVNTIEGDVPGEGHRGITDLNGTIGVTIRRRGQVTAAHQTTSDGRTVTSAFTTVGPDTGRLELPIERALRQGLGQFRRFGIVTGDLTNTGAGNTRSLRASAGMTVQDFYDEVFLGRSSNLNAPIQSSPSGTATAFRVGVPQGLGNVAGVEGDTTGGVFSLQRLGVRLGLPIAEGTLTAADVPLIHLANQSFLIRNAITNRHLAITDADMRFDLAGQLSSGLLVDIARNVGGTSLAVAGNDVSLTLPGQPAGTDRYVVGVGGTVVTGGYTFRQQVFAKLDGTTIPDVRMLALPNVTSPVPNATVSSSGFTVDFVAPDPCHYVVVQLRSEAGNDIRDWTAVIPYENDRFTFHLLPSQAPDVLVAGRTWTLSVTCARIDTGLLVDPSLTKSTTYARIQANWVGLTEADREVSAFSSVGFSVTTN